MKAKPSPYRVEGEIGRFRFTTYRLEAEGEVLFDSGRALFPALPGEEWYLTRGCKEIALFPGVAKRSYRETTAVLNRMRRVEEGTPLRSLRSKVSERERNYKRSLRRKPAASCARTASEVRSKAV